MTAIIVGVITVGAAALTANAVAAVMEKVIIAARRHRATGGSARRPRITTGSVVRPPAAMGVAGVTIVIDEEVRG